MSEDETHHAVELIRRLTEGKTVVIIEHDMDVVFSLADRITVLHSLARSLDREHPPERIKETGMCKDAYLGDLEGLEMLLEVNELNTYYGASHALQGMSLSVDKGEIVGLLGRNGMGKSTILKSIMGLVKAQIGIGGL